MTKRARVPPARFLRSVRGRMLLIALLPLLIVLPLLLLTAVRSWTLRFDEVLISKVHSELTTAHQHLDGLTQSRGAAVAALANSVVFASTPGQDLPALLEAERLKVDLDFLYFVPARPLGPAASDTVRWPVIAAALNGQQKTAIDIFSAADLTALSPHLAGRARLSLVPTKAAVPSNRTEESRGMVVHVASPAPGGALVGGVLLNRNLHFIDQMNDLVYPSEGPTAKDAGTATLFLDDVRISTNVRLFEDVRALGTRVSAAVRTRVLDEGKVWLDRAFVVNDWYVSAYEPIIDSFGLRVGMLYVGFQEAPYAEARRSTLYQIALTFGLVLLLSVPVLLRWARAIFKPLERMDAVMRTVESGDLGARVHMQVAEDEISRVAAHLDNLLDELQEREQRLRNWTEELETRVSDRTADLEQANLQLDQTMRQLIVSEKLAAIGEITAGVAHEINNPLAVIQGNVDVVRDDLGERGESLRTEFTLIQQQIHAINILVSKLLGFARPEEYAETGSGVDPCETIRQTLPLVQHLLTGAGIKLDLSLDAKSLVSINQTELQQVLVNLLVNSVQAMPQGGALRILAQDQGATLLIAVEDTGSGMPAEVLARIFDPFYTTKRAEGTGLGLSISRTLITRAGGTIAAASTPGQGSRFEIALPARH